MSEQLFYTCKVCNLEYLSCVGEFDMCQACEDEKHEAEKRKALPLFYFCGRPVFEGDETHQILEDLPEDKHGRKDIMSGAKKIAKDIENQYKGLFK